MAVFDALQDDAVREVNLLKPVRSGGTTIADVFLPWTIDNDPGPYMHAFQADDIADAHAKERTLPTLRNTADVRDLIPGGKINTADIQLRNGYKLYINGPSLANFQTKGIRYMVLDEPWMYDVQRPRGAIEQARGRLGDYLKQNTSKLFCLSQGGYPEGDWDLQVQTGLMHEWTVQCAKCRKFMLPDWFTQRPDGSFSGMKWGLGVQASACPAGSHGRAATVDPFRLPNGDWNIPALIPTIRFECHHCGHAHPLSNERRTKEDWNRSGKYLFSPFPPVKISFHWSAVIDFPWTELVELWCHASNYARRGIIQHKLDFYHKRWARFADEQMLLEGAANLKRVVYDIQSRTGEEHLRFLTIDKQSLGFYWWTVRAWAKDGRSWRLGFGSATSAVELREIQQKYKVKNTTIDSRYEPLGDRGVFADCIRYGWIAVQGSDRAHFSHPRKTKDGLGHVLRSYSTPQPGDPERGTSRQGRRYCALVLFSVNRLNKAVQELIDAGLWEEPAGGVGVQASACPSSSDLESEYNRQMGQRILCKEFDKKTQRLKEYWRSGRDDHARDLANQQVLLAKLADLLPDELSVESETR